jgi:Fungal specific transcription factor domain
MVPDVVAIKNLNLLNLLLAYSASHRARLLSQPEPATRIAHWVQDVFPSLRHALDDAENIGVGVSDANLATAIMLTSLEIISPSAFGVSMPWQNHLNAARRIIRYRGNSLQPVSRKSPIPHFLHLWLAYIDVFGSLSSRTLEEPLFYGDLQDIHDDTASVLSDDDDYTIECMLGFTSHCVPILAQIASLARLCYIERSNAETGEIDQDWEPTPEILLECDRLEADLENSRTHSVKHCPHYRQEGSPTLRRSDSMTSDDALAVVESVSTNDAFHHAGLIHLLRRVRNAPRSAPEIQNAIGDIVGTLSRVRPAGSAEACLLFPMFTAGVEAEDEETRLLILDRVKSLEEIGMMQVGRARALMEKVWETGQEWETLAQGEFVG